MASFSHRKIGTKREEFHRYSFKIIWQQTYDGTKVPDT